MELGEIFNIKHEISKEFHACAWLLWAPSEIFKRLTPQISRAIWAEKLQEALQDLGSDLLNLNLYFQVISSKACLSFLSLVFLP